MTLGEKIKKLRSGLEISQNELGIMLGYKQSMISSLENNVREPSYTALKKLSKISNDHKLRINFL